MTSPAPEARRPRIFTPGAAIGMHLRVERLVRIAGDRVYYLVNNRSPRWYTKKCWECGFKHSPPNAQSCGYCSSPLHPRRFLMSARWDPGSALEYQAFVHRRLRHRALGTPLALFRYNEQLLACFPWEHDYLLLGEPSPLPARTVLSLAFHAADALSHLHAHGVILKQVSPGNLLVHPHGTARLFDLEVARLVDRPLPASDDPTQPPLRDLRDLASVLERWVSPGDADVLEFLKSVRRGAFKTADDLAAGVSSFSWSRADVALGEPVAVLSDTGVARNENQDGWTWRRVTDDGLKLYVVCDGMGGEAHGAMASALATRTLARSLQRSVAGKRGLRHDELEQHLRSAMEQANTALVRFNAEQGTHSGTTAVALLIHGPLGVVGNLGDSRAYRLREGQLTQLTEDHSVVAARVAAGTLSAADAREHPDAHVLLHYLGREEDADPDIYQLDLAPGDRLLLCTDGLWGEVDDRRIAALLGEDPDPRRTVRRLVRAANDAGGRDNVTAMVVDVPFPELS